MEIKDLTFWLIKYFTVGQALLCCSNILDSCDGSAHLTLKYLTTQMNLLLVILLGNSLLITQDFPLSLLFLQLFGLSFTPWTPLILTTK